MGWWSKLTGAHKARKVARKNKKAKKKYLKKMKKGKHIKKISPYSKEQNKLLKWLSKQVKGKLEKDFNIKKEPTYKAGQKYLNTLLKGGADTFRDFEAPMMREFREQVMPQIAEQYAGAGAGRSSAFNLAAANAGGTLAEQLAAQRAQMQMRSLGPALQYAQVPIEQKAALANLPLNKQPSQLYAPPFVPEDIPKTRGSLIGTIGGGLIGGLIGGPPGAMIGAGLGGAAVGGMTDVEGSEGDYMSGMRGFTSALGSGFGKKMGSGLGDWLMPSSSPVNKKIEASSATPAFYGTMGTS